MEAAEEDIFKSPSCNMRTILSKFSSKPPMKSIEDQNVNEKNMEQAKANKDTKVPPKMEEGQTFNMRKVLMDPSIMAPWLNSVDEDENVNEKNMEQAKAKEDTKAPPKKRRRRKKIVSDRKKQAKIGPNKEKKPRKVRAPSKRDPLYRKMREFIRDLCLRGVGATESDVKLREKFGAEHSPTIRTVYMWRRKMRGGKGERQASSSEDEEDTESDNENENKPEKEGPNPAKRAKMAVEKKLASTFRRDQSLPASSTWLRRSTRVPKSKSSKLYETFPIDFLGLEMPTKSRKVVSFKPVESEQHQDHEEKGTALNGGGWKNEKQANMEQKGTRHAEPTSSSSSSDEEGEEQERFVTIYNDGRVELDEEMETSSSATQQKAKLLMSPATLDAANALMKLVASFRASPPASFTADNDKLNSSNTTRSINDDEKSSSAVLSPTIDIGTDSVKQQHSSALSPSSIAAQQQKQTSMYASNMLPQPQLQSQTPSMGMGTRKLLPNILKNGHFGKERMAQKELAMAEQNQLQQQQQSEEAVNNDGVMTAQNGQGGEEERAETAGQQPMANKEMMQLTTIAASSASMQTEEKKEEKRSSFDAIQSPSELAVAAQAMTEQQSVIVPQDESTWFGHSVAAQLREMRTQTKELVKMRIQQVIFECSTKTTDFVAPMEEGIVKLNVGGGEKEESEQHLASSSSGGGVGGARRLR